MAERREENKKIARLAEVVFLRFQFQLRGCRGLICGFSDPRAISLLFFPRGAGASAGESK